MATWRGQHAEAVVGAGVGLDELLGPRGPARRGRRVRHTGAANWLWPPGRRRNITSQRATVSATSTPWSSSTRARARSIPAVTPAEVQTSPSRIQIGSASTSTSGCSAARPRGPRPVGGDPAPVEQAGGGEQKAPLHTLTTRRARAASVADGADQRVVVAGGVHAVAAGDDQRVDVVHARSSGAATSREAALGAAPGRRRRRPRRRPRRATGRSRRVRTDARRRRRRPRAGPVTSSACTPG